MSRWVTNASPLIFLAKLDRLDLLNRSADEIWVPTAVLEEISVGDDPAWRRVQEKVGAWLAVADPDPLGPVKTLRPEVGKGEAEAIALALELEADRVVLDDLDARRWARRLGAEPVGTLGILLAARLRGEIPSLATEIEKLRSLGFRVGSGLVEAVLREAGEP